MKIIKDNQGDNMKVIYEYDLPDDQNELSLAQYASDMFNSLYNISGIIRKFRKGWIEDDSIDALMDEISDELFESNYEKIE